MGTPVYKVAAKLVAVFTVMMLVLAFGGCECGGETNDSDHCVAACPCHGVTLAVQTITPVLPHPDRQAHRPANDSLRLPLFVADIFNPPKV